MNQAEKVEEILKELSHFFNSLDHLPEMNSIDEIIGVGSHLALGADIVVEAIRIIDEYMDANK
ncbi:hypothetical protein C3943_13075 [Lysinibacillus sp. B2A1]|nr:hypothetical protein C3943_13075 [Lysinibacillus sp. B2A1]